MTYDNLIEQEHQRLIDALPASFNASQRALVEDAFSLAAQALAAGAEVALVV